MLSIQQTADSGSAEEAKREEFTKLWFQVRPQVVALCRRSFRDAADGDDVLGRIALRAWRGFADFRGESSFSTWVISIARREIARTHAREDARQQREVSLEVVSDNAPERLPSHPAPADPSSGAPTRQNALSGLVKKAVAASELSEVEARVVLARMAQPTLSWNDLALTMGMDSTVCAVAHCRAIPKLRVFLFLRYPSFLGGTEAIEEAFEAAQNDSSEPLSTLEANTFRGIVLEKSSAYRKPGWRLALRAACNKVVKKLPLP
ncbi:hypothetical protein IAD21_06294 [Abditibacteriota bacterium]|nr:hypothetical protein IAD21_06294 [Abditibacteriota bacterium]